MIALEDVQRARVQIAPYVKRTALERNTTLSRELGANVYLKLDSSRRPARSSRGARSTRSCN